MSSSSEILSSQRDLFDLPGDVTFLNCANLSPQLRSVTAAGVDAVRGKESPWEITAADFFRGPESLRSAAASLLGAEADDVACATSTSTGQVRDASTWEASRSSCSSRWRSQPSRSWKIGASGESRPRCGG